MYFAALQYSYLFIVIPILILLFVYKHHKKKMMLAKFMDYLTLNKMTLHIDYNKILLKEILIILAFVFFVLAALQPQFGLKKQVLKAKGLDIVFVLDVSRSMLAQDIKPNRLEKAKYEISRLVDKLKGDRVGLVIFAGSAFVQVPLTLDYAIFKMFLDQVTPDLISVPGTNITEALKEAAGLFNIEDPTSKIIILLTDGEDTSGEAVRISKEIKKENIKIYTIGIGNPEGALIPILDKNGKIIDYKKDKNGNYIKTKLDTKTLRKIALKTGASSYIAGANDMDLGSILDKIRKIEKKAIQEKNVGLYEDRFQIPLFIGLLLLLLATFMGETKAKIVNMKKMGVLIFVFYCLFLGNTLVWGQNLEERVNAKKKIPSSFFPWWSKLLDSKFSVWEKGLQAYYHQKWDEAHKYFNKLTIKDPDNPEASFARGDIYYKEGKYKEAIDELEKAVLAKDKNLKAKAYYNMGNCYYRMNKYKEALESYKKCLKFNPDDKDAKYNIEVIRKKMLENAKKQQQSNSNKKNQKQNKKGQSQQQQQQQSQQKNKKQQNQKDSQQESKKKEQKEKEKESAQKEKKDKKSKTNNQRENQKKQEKRKDLSSQEKYSKKELDKKEARKLLKQILEQEKANWKKRLQRLKQQSHGNYDVEKDW